ncbi:MAG: hypothetical protein HYU29_01780 [Chloroflexi bacterium]|nr:hypothetical protein [Chloroflexota bacterium]
MADRLRNIFDQYSQLENRVTHALAHALVSDMSLRTAFSQQAARHETMGKPAIIVQDRSGQGDSVPDLTILDESGFRITMENKLQLDSVEADQLARHWKRVAYGGQQSGCVLVITPDLHEPKEVQGMRQDGANIRWVPWQQVYQWMMELGRRKPTAAIALAFCEYLRQVEGVLQKEGNDVMLSTFDGIDFKQGVRDDSQARSLLAHIRRHIESSGAMRQQFPGLNPQLGRKQSSYWTSIGLVRPASEEERSDPFNKHPHLTIEFEEAQFSAFIVLPHAARHEYKRRASEATLDAWRRVFADILEAILRLEEAPKPVPYVLIEQRHWITRKGAPTVDGKVEFTLDTLASSLKVDGKVKDNEKWFSVVPSLIRTSSQANIEVQVGLHYPYGRCEKVLGDRDFPDHLVQAIGTLQPFFRLLTDEPRT